MLFSTFYFSGTGNTKWAVEQFSQIIIQSRNRAEIYSIDNFDECSSEKFTNIVKQSDFIGFANPIYGADVPPIMKHFISFLTEKLKVEGICSKPFYVINTFGYVNACGPFKAKKLFDKDCFVFMAYTNIKLCNNISTFKFKSSPISRESLNVRKKRAVKTLKALTNRLLLTKKSIGGIGLYLLPGIIIRKKLEKGIRNHYQSLSVQTKTCSNCMVCVNQCPTHCIQFNGQQFEFSDRCTSCMRCYNICPTSSILIDGVFTDPNEYVRYRGLE